MHQNPFSEMTTPQASLNFADRENMTSTPVGVVPPTANYYHQPPSRHAHNATPLNQQRSQQPSTPSKRGRTSHSMEDHYLGHGRGKLVVKRDAPSSASERRNSTDLSTKLGRLAVGSQEREQRPSMRLDPFRDTTNANNVMTMAGWGATTSMSPQCTPVSSSSPFAAQFQRPSMPSVHQPSPDCWELSQADTDLSTFVARRIITEYRELRELGQGMFGHVVLCEQMNSGDLVAIKVSHPLSCRDMLQRARRERDILNALRGFPHIIHLCNSWEEGKTPQMHLEMQFCPGGSLSSLAHRKIHQGERWSEEEILTLMGQLAMALDAVHSVNVAHVDVKPDNILIDESLNYVLTDFGCGLTLDENGRPRDHLTGSTFTYSQPTGASTFSQMLNDTQASQQSHDEGDKRYVSLDMMNEKRFYKSGDVFSFGMSLYELMSGEPLPLSGDRYEYLRNRSGSLDELEAAGYTKPLCDLVLRMIQRDPLARPTAREVLEFPALRPNATALQWMTVPTAQMRLCVMNNTLSGSSQRFMKTCFEVSFYLMEAVNREALQVYPSSCRKLVRGSSVGNVWCGEGMVGSPLRSSQGAVAEVVYRTPTTRPVDR